MNDYCYQALLSRTLSKQLPRRNRPGMGREKEGVGSIILKTAIEKGYVCLRSNSS